MSTFQAAGKTAEEIKDELDKKEASPEEQVADLSEPRLAEKWTFAFKYTDRRGRKWAGEFENQILSIDDVTRVGTIRAASCGNAPLEALDMATVQNAEALAHCTVSLIKRPKWAAQLGRLKDGEILRRLYQEVSSHEDIFHGRGEDQEAGLAGATDVQG
ncbi:MAG: hypothetical protein KJN79_09280 [Gammaproteobacteria bacterium]|nr:hypothetical protein [Gammaproteobacteria bacterium]